MTKTLHPTFQEFRFEVCVGERTKLILLDPRRDERRFER